MRHVSATFLLLFFAAVAAAQELSTVQSADTLVPKSLVFPDSKNSLARASFIPQLRISDLEISREFPTSSFGYALLSESPVPEKRADLYWQTGFNWKNEDPLDMLRTMLGAVEAGGASYLAYRHISKYGFLK